jgi:hypothetical protein
LPSVQTLHVGATVAKVHGYAKTQNQNRASVIVSPHHRASIETPYARTPSLSLILSLSFPRVHLARFQNITKKKRTNLLPILPSVHLHRLTQQLILRAANERLSVTPQHSRTNHASRNQSITRSLDRSTRASAPPQSSRSPSPPSRRLAEFQNFKCAPPRASIHPWRSSASVPRSSRPRTRARSSSSPSHSRTPRAIERARRRVPGSSPSSRRGRVSSSPSRPFRHHRHSRRSRHRARERATIPVVAKTFVVHRAP